MSEEKNLGASRQSLNLDKSSKFYHFFNFMQQEYGNDLEKMLKRFNSVLTLGLATRFIKNEKWKKRIQFGQGLLTAGLFSADFLVHLKNYRKTLKNEKESLHDKRMVKVCKIMEIHEKSPFYANLPHSEVYVNTDIISWILNKPNTTKFKILDYYNIETLEKVTPNLSDAQTQVGVLISIKNQKIMWDIDVRSIAGALFTRSSFILGECIEDEQYRIIFKNIIISDYIDSLDTKKNALFFDNWGYLYPRERRSVEERINQFDVDTLIAEIREVLNKKRRRAYAFVGRQGVGKSAILRKIEESITEYIIVHLTPSDFDRDYEIKDRFETIKNLQPVIVIIEDLDSCGLKDKNKLTGNFLNCIDEINRDLNMVLVVSINDTSSVHYTILNRPGRFDRIQEIKSPQTLNEIKEVMLSKIKSIKDNYCEGGINENNLINEGSEEILEKCLTSNFTQAEITNALIEQVFIDINIDRGKGVLKEEWGAVNHLIFSEYMKIAIEKHFKTKEALKNCNFNNQSPEEKDYKYPSAQGIGHSYGGSEGVSSSYYERRFKNSPTLGENPIEY